MSIGEMTTKNSDPWAHWDGLLELLLEFEVSVDFSGPVNYINPESDQTYQMAATALAFCSLCSKGKRGRGMSGNYLRLAKYLMMRPSLVPEFEKYASYKLSKRKQMRAIRLPRAYSADPNHRRVMRYLVACKVLRTTDRMVYESDNVKVLDGLHRKLVKMHHFGAHRNVIASLREPRRIGS